mmetsp:Transcript_7028/g.20566  ORF Transcript_7028/g.20566 Transcript_7028/m.20566 type:complete len:360 (-) Transcript_7028:330-1409(-)|eukprot:CAMPEP_0206143080 /NCGR_PEP_ID=MMETSP1473-20131121/19215_1 /ASSEMBLY_ACC=CAM_ASM_001109 /TAXON_ID=1461547 /ORGANISM="Stichococcus sp, Strain RCC1054" /LENGTH=359 /DNA_ID=CAMNT_0053538323 /DNA_START=222 /DNA_END=1301 /DNA_ORIENTATION=+
MLLAALQSRSPVALRTASKSAGRVLKEASPVPASRLIRSPLTSSQQLQLQHPYRGGNRGSTTTATLEGSTATMPDFRSIKQTVQGQKQMEGAGVRICRSIGTGALRNLDPYLMLDELKLPPGEATSGFPDHPHRGFETCSIMLSGKMEHRDHVGNHGVIGPGGVQWMTAGRGIIHSEMPVQTDDKLLHGFQLWINLPASKKMMKPQYQDYQAADIPSVEGEGATVRVMAGTRNDTTGPIKMRNPGLLMDVRLDAGAKFSQDVPRGWNGFCYVYEGAGKIGGAKAKIEQNLVMSDGDSIQAEASGDSPLKFLLVAGKPIGEPIVQYGPFVMNTDSEIKQAFMDYQTGRLQNPEDDVWADE